MKQITRFGIMSLPRQSGRRFCLAIAIGVIALVGRPGTANAQTLTILHSFGATLQDGQTPGVGAPLTAVGSTLYGTTTAGGTNNSHGTIFAINPDGSGYTNLHQFGSTQADGQNPQASLTLVGSTLYGITSQGGTNNSSGTVFAINSDGSGYTLLHQFGRTGDDGWNPRGALTLVGSTLYGTTLGSSLNGYGVVFAIHPDGSGYTNLYQFGSTVAHDGQNPWASLTAVGSRLYGTSREGGTHMQGTVFAIDTNGANYAILHNFGSIPVDGQNPEASLTAVGSRLYGTTFYGGGVGHGTIFAINTDGSGFTNLYQFVTTNYFDSYNASAALTLLGSTLYGTAGAGGGNGINGTVYTINTNGSDYTIVYGFGAGGANDAADPEAALTLVGSTFYGTSRLGGDYGAGTVFKLVIATNAAAAISCVLSPALATNNVGTAATVTATVTSNGVAHSGVVVNFSVVAGPNLGHTGSATTSVSGQGSFTYTSTAPGTDTIRAIAGSATGTATIVWAAAGCPAITLAPATLPDGTLGVPYTQAITASSGLAPRHFAVTTGTLPAGLNLSSAGTLSGTPSAMGAAGFTITATDANACTGSADYSLTVNAAPPVPHNFAVTKITASKKVTLKAGVTPKPSKVQVAIQNLGTRTEVIAAASLSAFVTLQIESLGACAVPAAVLQPPKTPTVTLKPHQTLTLTWLVTISCANDQLAGAGHEDYRYHATVDPSVLDGNPDTVPANNTCPRPPNPAIGDKGCGMVDPASKQLGGPVLTDVFEKP